MLSLELDQTAGTPMYRQLFDGLRRAIHHGALRAGTRLAPTRVLASELAISRNTVNTAYELLVAEGYVNVRPGAGYFVGATLPDPMLESISPVRATPASAQPVRRRMLSARGEYLATPSRPVSAFVNAAFQRGLPALERFPHQQWQHHIDAFCRRPESALLKYQDNGGLPELKTALRDYLTISRGVRCDTRQIIVVTGGQAALDLIARLLVDEGDHVAIEEPGYLGARDAMLAAGARLHPAPVDADGLIVDTLDPASKLVYVTPSYQFPLGVTMGAARRIQLLQWARVHDAYIVEDDYDSEFRFRGRPLSSLQGLDDDSRVIYVGTFSKVMFPALRLGYLVVPDELCQAFSAALRKTGQDAPLLLQAAMAGFINAGQFLSHIRRMRNLYRQRQALFVALAEKHLAPWLTVSATDAGMQLVGYFLSPMNESKIMVMAMQAELDVALLSAYYVGEAPLRGLYLGYAGITDAEMAPAIVKLASVLAACRA